MQETQSLNQPILATLDHCLMKMSDRLCSAFNPDDKQSLSLFKQFCSAVKTRLQWIKSFIGIESKRVQEKPSCKPINVKNAPAFPALPGPGSSSLVDRLIEERKKKNPLPTENAPNGLLCAR